jgi:hypothetical protein
MSTTEVNELNGQVQVIFEKGEDPYIYRDALYFTPEDYAALTEADIEAMQEARYQGWITHINTPVEDPVDAGDTPAAPQDPVGEYIEINGVKYIKANI